MVPISHHAAAACVTSSLSNLMLRVEMMSKVAIEIQHLGGKSVNKNASELADDINLLEMSRMITYTTSTIMA